MANDPWGTSTGLIDEYEGTVVESFFGINAVYNPDLHLIFWRVLLDNPEEFPQIDEGIIQEQFSLGESWESNDGGLTVEYPGNPSKKFNANTQYGRIIDRAIQEWDLRDVLSSKGDGPQDAKIWEGLRFHFKAQILGNTFTNSKGEVVEPRPKVMPIAFLGTGNISIPEPVFDVTTLGLDDEQLSELRKAADSADSYGQFLDKAMKLTWVSGHATMISALADQAIWQAIRSF